MLAKQDSALVLGQRGHWRRHGGTIVVLPDRAVDSGGNEIGELPAVAIPSQRDLIDSRIDVHAQYALHRMFRSHPAARADAAEMFAAIKAGDLAGIYVVNQAVPALRARKINRWWWELIPKAEDAIVLLDPANPMAGPPLIAFRDQVKGNPARLDPALQKSWKSFELWQAGQLARCGPGAGQSIETEIFSCVPLGNVVPSIPGQLLPPGGRAATPVPILLKGDAVRDLLPAVPPATRNLFCMGVQDEGFRWRMVGTMRFPRGSETGLWRIGFVQNTELMEVELRYSRQGRIGFTEQRQLLDIDLDVGPFFPPFAAVDPRRLPDVRTNAARLFRNPHDHFSDGKEEDVEFAVTYSDRPSILVDTKFNNDPNDRLEFARDTSVFRTFLVSLRPSGRIVVQNASTPYRVEVRCEVPPDPSEKVDFDTVIENVQFGPAKGVRPVTSGPTAESVFRAKFAELGVNKGPAQFGCRPGSAAK